MTLSLAKRSEIKIEELDAERKVVKDRIAAYVEEIVEISLKIRELEVRSSDLLSLIHSLEADNGI